MNFIPGKAYHKHRQLMIRERDYLAKCHQKYKKNLQHSHLDRTTGKPAEWLIALMTGGLTWDDVPPGILSEMNIPHRKDYGIDITNFVLDVARQVKDYCEKSTIRWGHYSTFNTMADILNIKPENRYIDTTLEAKIDSMVQMALDKGDFQLIRHDFDHLISNGLKNNQAIENETNVEEVLPKQCDFTLRPPQEEALNCLLSAPPDTPVRVQMPPGVGKTYISMAYILQHSQPGSCHLFVVPWKALAVQTREVAERLGIHCQSLGDGLTTLDTDQLKLNGGLVVCVAPSLCHLPPELRFDLKVIDEAHHYENVDSSHRISINKIPSQKTLELSATFACRDNLDYNLSMSDAVEAGYITDYKVRFDIFQETPQFSRNQATHQLVMENLVHWSPIFVYYNSTESARKASRKFQEEGVSCRYLDGDTPASIREEVAVGLRDGSSSPIDVVCLCGVWNEGVSHHRLRTVIFSDPRSSPTNIVQVASRANRLHPEKPFYQIVFVTQEKDFDDDRVAKTIRTIGNWDGRLARQIRARDSSRVGIGEIRPREDIEEVESGSGTDSESDSSSEDDFVELLETRLYDRLGKCLSFLSPVEKARELVEKVAKEHKIPTKKSTDTFSDGIKMGTFWKYCKGKDWKENNQEAFKLLMSQETLQKDYQKTLQKLTVIQKAHKLVEKVAKEHKIPFHKSTDTFSDGTKMGIFWNTCKGKDWKENNQEAFKLLMSQEILQQAYHKCLQKRDNKSLNVIQKARELVEKVAKEHKIPFHQSTDTFSDGTKMGTFWNTCKGKDWKENNQEAFKLLMSQEILQQAYHKTQQKRNTKKNT